MTDVIPYDDLETIGFVYSGLEVSDVPRLASPEMQVKSSKRVIDDYMFTPDGLQVLKYWPEAETRNIDEIESFHRMPAVSPDENFAFYIPEGKIEAEYLSHDEIAQRLTTFSDAERVFGDECFKERNLVGALPHYERASIASEEARDYARILLCEVPEKRQERLAHYISDLVDFLDDDMDWKNYVEGIKQEILDDS